MCVCVCVCVCCVCVRVCVCVLCVCVCACMCVCSVCVCVCVCVCTVCVCVYCPRDCVTAAGRGVASHQLRLVYLSDPSLQLLRVLGEELELGTVAFGVLSGVVVTDLRWGGGPGEPGVNTKTTHQQPASTTHPNPPPITPNAFHLKKSVKLNLLTATDQEL